MTTDTAGPASIENVIDELIRLRDLDQVQLEALQRRVTELEAQRWWHRPAAWLRWIAGAPA